MVAPPRDRVSAANVVLSSHVVCATSGPSYRGKCRPLLPRGWTISGLNHSATYFSSLYTWFARHFRSKSQRQMSSSFPSWRLHYFRRPMSSSSPTWLDYFRFESQCHISFTPLHVVCTPLPVAIAATNAASLLFFYHVMIAGRRGLPENKIKIPISKNSRHLCKCCPKNTVHYSLQRTAVSF
jgi:hypothetical protein